MLAVHCREREDQTAAAGHDALEALAEGRVERDLRGVQRYVLDGEVLARADVAGPVVRVGEGDLEHEVELGREELSTIEDPYEVRAHEHVPGARLRDLEGVAPAVRQEAHDVLVEPPVFVFE